LVPQLSHIPSTLRVAKFIAFIFFLTCRANAQVAGLSNASVSGPFFFRHLQITTDTQGNITDARTALGSMTFDGKGRYSLAGQQTIANQPVTNLSVSGSYTVDPAGVMTIGNPQRNNLFINARLGTEAIVGSTTESGDNTFDLFIAIPAPSTQQSSTAFSGTYYVTALEFPLSTGADARSAFFSLTPGSNGIFSNVSGSGHALNVNSGQIGSINLTGASYALASDGSGTASFGSVNNFLSGLKNLYVSASGNIILMGSVIAASQDFLVGVRANSTGVSIASWSGLSFTGGLRYDGKILTTAGYVGASDAIPSLARLTSYQRTHQIAINPLDTTGYEAVVLNTNGTFTEGINLVGLGPNGTSFVENNLATNVDPNGFAISFGIQAPALKGSGVYINPQGILNGGSFAPTGSAIAPGEFVSIFGSGLAAATATASPPYPASLGGVTVKINDTLAPLTLVSANQVNLLVPYGVTGSTATVVVTNSGTASNSMTVPLAASAPGVFSQDSTGSGIGAILHANNSLVTTANPAKRGETIQIYLTGLGAVAPPVPDGAAGVSDPLSKTVSPAAVYLNGQKATVVYSGLAPGLPGLYQMNVTIPSGLVLGTGPAVLAIQTAEAFTDTADIPIQ
jgi:uncharacterized protein (TIGR03437 family)